MKSKISPWRSLKIRVTVLTLGSLVLGIWALAFYVSHMLQVDMQRVLGQQQLQTVSLIAAQVNDELSSRQAALERIAKDIDARLMAEPTALQTLLEQRPLMQILFNGGVFATGVDGTAIADVPLSTGRIGTNYLDRESVSGPLKTGKTVIGRPAMGKKLGAPIFSIVAPIHDAAGAVIGTLVGTVNLGKPNFLDKNTQGQYGKTGGFLLIAPEHKLFVTASDKTRIMQPIPAPGLNTMHDRYMQGYEGFGVAVSSRGVEELNAAKAIPVAGWFLGVVMPTAEAFAPIHSMQQRMLWATALLTLLTGALTWWLLQRQLAPVLDTASRLSLLAKGDLPTQALPVAHADEIGALVGGFNHLLETLGEREALLTESDQRNRHFFEKNSSVMLLIDPASGEIVEANPAAERYYGYARAQLVGMNISTINTATPERVAEERQKALREERKYFQFSHRLACGELRDVEVYSSPIKTGGRSMLLSIVHDITERRRAEDMRNELLEQVRQLAYFDPLTQLPNRRLLDDRLSQALAASKRSGLYGALMFLDLDNFKSLNDTHGHAAGDLLLMEGARRLTACVRETDTVARLGGDEFVVLLNELHTDQTTSTEQAAAVAEKIRAALAAPYQLSVTQPGDPATTVEHHCSVSIGVVVFVNHLSSQTDLMKWADAAMYQAKDAGRNRVQFYEPYMPLACAELA